MATIHTIAERMSTRQGIWQRYKQHVLPAEHIPEHQTYLDDELKQFSSAPVAAMAIAAWTPEFVKFLRDQSQKQGHPVPNIALSAQADHQDRVSTAGDISETYWGLIHQPVSIPKALRIPKVREALDKEWQKLDKGRVWFMDTVAEKKEVEAKCQKNGIECEFCNVIELRHNNKQRI